MTEAKALRRTVEALAAAPDWDLLTRYDLLRKKPPTSWQERAWRRVRRLLASVKLISPHVTRYQWLAPLKHKPVAENATTVMIWALGADRHQLRAACESFSKRFQGDDSVAPVLVTDIADFAFYSRLGWLVEYVPSLRGDGPSYQQRKQVHLAWRYRDACIVPLSAGSASDAEWRALLRLN